VSGSSWRERPRRIATGTVGDLPSTTRADNLACPGTQPKLILPLAESAQEIPKQNEAVCDRGHRGVGCGLQRQPQANGTTPRLTGVSVAVRISPSVLVPDLTGKEKGASIQPPCGKQWRPRVTFPALCLTDFPMEHYSWLDRPTP